MFILTVRRALILIVRCSNKLTKLLRNRKAIKRMPTNELILCSSEVLGGTPVFNGTRVPIKNLIDYLKAGDSLNDFLEDFPSVSREQAVQFLALP